MLLTCWGKLSFCNLLHIGDLCYFRTWLRWETFGNLITCYGTWIKSTVGCELLWVSSEILTELIYPFVTGKKLKKNVILIPVAQDILRWGWTTVPWNRSSGCWLWQICPVHTEGQCWLPAWAVSSTKSHLTDCQTWGSPWRSSRLRSKQLENLKEMKIWQKQLQI